MKYYKGYKGESIDERIAFEKEFNQMKNQASNGQQEDKPCLNLKDLCKCYREKTLRNIHWFIIW